MPSEKEKTKVFKKISRILAAILVIAVAVSAVIDLIFHQKIEEYLNKENILAAFIFLIIGAFLIWLISERVMGNFLERILCMNKCELHGWWIYLFLFDATQDELINSVCLSVEGKNKVLVVGFMEMYQDDFEFRIEKNNATSKTFSKTDRKLLDRTDLKINNIDFRNDCLIIIYEIVPDSGNVPFYRGVMDLNHKFNKSVIIETTKNEDNTLMAKILNKLNFRNKHLSKSSNTVAFKGMIQDLNPKKKLIQNKIFSQHLKDKKNQEDVETALENNADQIIKYVTRYSHGTLI